MQSPPPPATTHRIRNPILPGFNPDPGTIRVGDDFYIATLPSSGFRVFASTTPAAWSTGALWGEVLTRREQADMRGRGAGDKHVHNFTFRHLGLEGRRQPR
ncbi:MULTISPECIES: family 43 glycosylhydrolase [Microbulbifer]|uniref:family 43 glycosylhydrolase n=1 Tax=Microbulbifer TaxID=48073 RepID=UPI001E31DABA|nr:MULTISPECIES: family 43 glycosylhydrolase [Microbulbifer]UHQ54376.1 family 43 glycosylhydrolase [Microbulbifer sp. YPW16]